ncbi:hypothetical protein [Aquimarina latercula]|uniref:hypothetical protein n=1 Tax=Aquimarina latercula TaxID=987 RepID=UPI00048066BA|nr:hypothetical protein [Aquimarina latercula]
MNTNISKKTNLNSDDLNKVIANRYFVKPQALASKNNCSVDYVNKVLSGKRSANSKLAIDIVLDAIKILRALGI